MKEKRKMSIMKHDRLTQYARIIFGDVIDSAYVYTDMFSDSKQIEKEIMNELESSMQSVETGLSEDNCVIKFEETDVMLQFVNGKEVFLSVEGQTSIFSQLNTELKEYL